MPGAGRNWWRAPIWVAQLATGAKSFIDNPILGSPSLNRRGLHVARLKAAHRLAWWRRSRLASGLSAEERSSFDRDGFVCIPDFLPPQEFEMLRDFLLGSEWPARQQQQGDTVTRRVAIDGDLLRSCPTLKRMLRSRRWKGLMQYVASAGGEPIYYLQSIVTGHDGPPDPQIQLHSDAFHPSLKAWLFLTDVTDEGGPLTYVAGSHLLTPQRIAWEKQRSETVRDNGDRLSQRGSLRIAPEEVHTLGLPEPTRFALPANTLVAIDTYGFHARGIALKPSVRVELWAYSRRSPFLPWTGMNLLSLPFLSFRRAGWAYQILDWLDARGLRQQHWLPSGTKKAQDR